MKFVISLGIYAATSAAALTLLSSTLHGRRIASLADVLSAAAEPRLLAGGVLYVASFLCWLYVLSQQPVSTAYPLAIGTSYAAVLLAAVLFLGDRISAIKVVGLVLVAVGAVCITIPGANS